MKRRFLSLSAMDNILRLAGAERVSDSAKEALAAELQNVGSEISKKAIKFAEHAGRKTVTAADIALALKK